MQNSRIQLNPKINTIYKKSKMYTYVNFAFVHVEYMLKTKCRIKKFSNNISFFNFQDASISPNSLADVLYIPLNQAPITSLLIWEDTLWCASANRVFILSALYGKFVIFIY